MCVCGEPDSRPEQVVHRTDGPCYQREPKTMLNIPAPAGGWPIHVTSVHVPGEPPGLRDWLKASDYRIVTNEYLTHRQERNRHLENVAAIRGTDRDTLTAKVTELTVELNEVRQERDTARAAAAALRLHPGPAW